MLNESTSLGDAEVVGDGDVIDESSEEPGVLERGGADLNQSQPNSGKSDARNLPLTSTELPDGEESDGGNHSTGKRHRPDDGAVPENERSFGPYTLLRRLAYGGMGEVFLARHDANIPSVGSRMGLARLVVIKRILNHMRRDEKQRQMFIDEARVQLLLQSAHIVQIHDVGEFDGQVFLAMEHVHGPSWRSLIDRCRKLRQHIPIAYVVEMMIHAAEGLSYAHNLHDANTGSPLRIVHRDINPHNMLVTYDGAVKLIDFGIAKSELREQQTETGTIKGKFAYMSPEQSAAEPLDARSDLFALGICLYELLTLTNPFKKMNIVLSLEAVQKSEPRALGTVRSGAAFLAPLVERMLRKNPDDRFADCAEVAASLRQLQQDGLFPEPTVLFPTWLRQVFAEEIQTHLRVLSQTGAGVDVAVSSTHLRHTSSFPSVRPQFSPSPPSPTSPKSPTSEAQDDDLPSALSLVADEQRTGPTISRQLQRPGTHPPWAAGFVIAFVVVIALVGGFLLLRAEDPAPVYSRTVIGATSGLGGVLDAGMATATLPDLPMMPVTDAGSVNDVGDAGVLDPHTAIDPDQPSDSERTNKPNKPIKPIKPIKPNIQAQAPDIPEEIVGRVAVSAEGFVVKGRRTVGRTAPAVLIVDDREAPFKLKLSIFVDNNGAPHLSVDSKPWAVVRVDQMGLGKTPIPGIDLVSGRKIAVALSNPSGAQMDLTVTFAARTAP